MVNRRSVKKGDGLGGDLGELDYKDSFSWDSFDLDKFLKDANKIGKEREKLRRSEVDMHDGKV